MAVVHFDGFEDYATGQIARYNNFSSGSPSVGANGRNSGNSMRMGRMVGKVLAAAIATGSAGIAMRFSQSAGPGHGGSFFSFYDGTGGGNQVTLTLNGTNQILARRGGANGTVLGTSALALNATVYYFIEVLVTVHPSAGVVTVNVNGVQWLNLTGLNTRNTGNSNFNTFFLGDDGNNGALGLSENGWGTVDYDDLYIDDAGTFHGDCRIETKFATGNGATNNFTPSTGSNYQNVDETTSNDDTDYNTSSAAGDIDLYTYPALSTVAGAVKAVMTVPVLRNDAAGLVTVESVYRSGGTNYFGADNNVGSTTYGAYPDIKTVDPATGIAWTVGGVNAAQFGLKRTA